MLFTPVAHIDDDNGALGCCGGGGGDDSHMILVLVFVVPVPLPNGLICVDCLENEGCITIIYYYITLYTSVFI